MILTEKSKKQNKTGNSVTSSSFFYFKAVQRITWWNQMKIFYKFYDFFRYTRFNLFFCCCCFLWSLVWSTQNKSYSFFHWRNWIRKKKRKKEKFIIKYNQTNLTMNENEIYIFFHWPLINGFLLHFKGKKQGNNEGKNHICERGGNRRLLLLFFFFGS